MTTLRKKDELVTAAFLASLNIETDEDWENMVAYAETLADYLDAGETEYEQLFDFVVRLISDYEAKSLEPVEISGAQMLRFLMEQHNHKLANLSDIAPKSVWSEILNGKRKLNKRHISELSEKYHVSPAVFF